MQGLNQATDQEKVKSKTSDLDLSAPVSPASPQKHHITLPQSNLPGACFLPYRFVFAPHIFNLEIYLLIVDSLCFLLQIAGKTLPLSCLRDICSMRRGFDLLSSQQV